ncbi:MAG: hypothetical protein WCA35_16810 [Kovacikia sp.]
MTTTQLTAIALSLLILFQTDGLFGKAGVPRRREGGGTRHTQLFVKQPPPKGKRFGSSGSSQAIQLSAFCNSVGAGKHSVWEVYPNLHTSCASGERNQG